MQLKLALYDRHFLRLDVLLLFFSTLHLYRGCSGQIGLYRVLEHVHFVLTLTPSYLVGGALNL